MQIPLITDPDEVFSEIKTDFEKIQEATIQNPFPSWKERLSLLERLEKLVVENQDAISEAINTDFGHRSALQTEMLDVLPLLNHIRLLKRKAKNWMRPRFHFADALFLPAHSLMMAQPKGIIGIISPWNYPLLLSMGPVAYVFASGNRCMVKLSEFAPVFADLIKKLVAKYFRPDEMCIITGDEQIASRFTSLPFDHLIFTGSSSVGKKVMTMASSNLVPVTLELGGKSPVLITPNYPLRHAAERVLFAKLLNSGQTCIAPDYVLIEHRAIPRFLGLLQEIGREFYPNGIHENDYTSIANRTHFERILNQLQQASMSSKIYPIFSGEQVDMVKRKIAPQVVTNPMLNESLMQEEIFAPVLPIVAYPDGKVEEALDFINSRPHALAFYLFDNDKKRIEDILRKTKCGGVTINDALWHATQSTLPFGGVGHSGMGSWTGKTGFDSLSHFKPVFYQSRFSMVSLLNPPYSSQIRQFIKKQITAKKTKKIQLILKFLKGLTQKNKE